MPTINDLQQIHDDPDIDLASIPKETDPASSDDSDLDTEYESERKKISINKTGIYAGEDYEVVHEFLSKEYLDNQLEEFDKRLTENVLVYDPDLILANRQDNYGYSQEQTDDLLAKKIDADVVYTKAETYTADEIDSKFSLKADYKNSYSKVDSDRSYLKIRDLPIAKNPAITNPTITDLNAASQNPFGQDVFAFTQTEYDALSEAEKLNNKLYLIIDDSTDEILDTAKPALVADQVKAVVSGKELRIDFSMYTNSKLVGEIKTSSYQDVTGSLAIYDTYAIFTAPQVTENGFVTLAFRGTRNGIQSSDLEVVIAVATNIANNKLISFDSNGAPQGTMDAITIAGDGAGKWTYTLPVCNFAPDINLEFSQWSTSTTDSTKVLGKAGDQVEFDNNDPITLYAIWKQVEISVVKVNYKSNGGSGTMDTDETSVSASEYVVRGCNFVPPEGKVFVMWGLDQFGNSGSCLPGDTLTFSYSQEVNLWAIWKYPSEITTIKPQKPVLDANIPTSIIEGEIYEYEFTNIGLKNTVVISDTSDLKGNTAVVENNKIKFTGVVGSVTSVIFVYQRTQNGVNSDLANFSVIVSEKTPDTLILSAPQALTANTNTTLDITFKNKETTNTLELNADHPAEVSISGSTVKVTSTDEGTISFNVRQVKTARNGDLLKSDPLAISVTFTNP